MTLVAPVPPGPRPTPAGQGPIIILLVAPHSWTSGREVGRNVIYHPALRAPLQRRGISPPFGHPSKGGEYPCPSGTPPKGGGIHPALRAPRRCPSALHWWKPAARHQWQADVALQHCTGWKPVAPRHQWHPAPNLCLSSHWLHQCLPADTSGTPTPGALRHQRHSDTRGTRPLICALLSTWLHQCHPAEPSAPKCQKAPLSHMSWVGGWETAGQRGEFRRLCRLASCRLVPGSWRRG